MHSWRHLWVGKMGCGSDSDCKYSEYCILHDLSTHRKTQGPACREGVIISISE